MKNYEGENYLCCFCCNIPHGKHPEELFSCEHIPVSIFLKFELEISKVNLNLDWLWKQSNQDWCAGFSVSFQGPFELLLLMLEM